MANIVKRPPSKYFNNFFYVPRQTLLQDLIEQAIKMHGMYINYMPREKEDRDILFGDDPFTNFNESMEIEIYVRTVDGFEGQGDILSKFDMEIQDQITFTVSRRRWDQERAKNMDVVGDRPKPRAGDLLYMPLVNKVFEIVHVEHENLFYQHGILLTYDIKCELFKYSHEEFNTGFDEIDDIDDRYSGVSDNTLLTNEDGDSLLNEDGSAIVLDDFRVETNDPSANNEFFQMEGDKIIDFGELSPFLKKSKW